MKPEFHHHPHNLIIIRTEYGTYEDTPENFENDFRVTLPPLPEGAIERIYTQGKRHAIHDEENNIIAGGPMPWDFGDQAIANIDAGLAAWANRQPVGEKVPPSISTKVAASMARRSK